MLVKAFTFTRSPSLERLAPPAGERLREPGTSCTASAFLWSVEVFDATRDPHHRVDRHPRTGAPKHGISQTHFQTSKE
jgi:hypothetical protein